MKSELVEAKKAGNWPGRLQESPLSDWDPAARGLRASPGQPRPVRDICPVDLDAMWASNIRTLACLPAYQWLSFARPSVCPSVY